MPYNPLFLISYMWHWSWSFTHVLLMPRPRSNSFTITMAFKSLVISLCFIIFPLLTNLFKPFFILITIYSLTLLLQEIVLERPPWNITPFTSCLKRVLLDQVLIFALVHFRDVCISCIFSFTIDAPRERLVPNSL